MRPIKRGWQAAGALALGLLVVPATAVQASTPSRAGIATAVAGQVTVSHAVAPTPQPLRFKDEVFLRDRISTASQSLARLLLGKKALLTVRELSELELTDQAGNSIIQLAWGKLAIGVARQRMRPGEIVEIRTENAIAAIRGTVVVAEALTPPGAAIPVSRLHVLHGFIDVTAPGDPGAPPVRMVAPSSVTVTGDKVGTPVRLETADQEALLSDLRPAQPQHVDVLDALMPGEQSRAAELGQVIANESAGTSEALDLREVPANPADTKKSIVQAPITPNVPAAPAGGESPKGRGGNKTAGGGAGLPFVYTNGTVAFPGDFYQIQPAVSRNLSTDLLRATNSTLTVEGDLVQVKGSLASATTLPLMSLDGGTLSAQTAALLRNGSFSLAGPLLAAVNSALTMSGPALVEAQANSTLTGSGASAFVSLTGGSLALAGGTSGLSLDAGSTASLAGSFLSTTGASLTGSSDFVAIKNSTLTDTGAAPFVTLTGGTSQIATAGSIFRLNGSSTAVDAASGLRVGTDEPIRTGGGLLDLNGAAVATQRAVTVDVALLQASAPLMNLRGGALLTTAGNAVDLASKAKVTNTASYVALDGSRLIVSAGALINVAGGSVLQAGGNLINLSNGSALVINNGVLLSVSGGSFVNISGALVAFGGAGGNTITVSNALSFVTIGGIPVALTGGAQAANVSITGTPIKNAALGTITPNKALIQVNGANSRLTISGN